MNRSPSMLEAQRRMFLQRLSETGNVTDAASHSGLNRCALYRARANNRAFGLTGGIGDTVYIQRISEGSRDMRQLLEEDDLSED